MKLGSFLRGGQHEARFEGGDGLVRDRVLRHSKGQGQLNTSPEEEMIKVSVESSIPGHTSFWKAIFFEKDSNWVMRVDRLKKAY